MKAKIKDKKEVAKGTLQVTYDLLGEKADFKPGQYFFVTLPTLHYPDERGNKRHFSVVNSPNEKGVLINTTRIRDTGFKKTLKELKVGSPVEVGPITGSFILPENTRRPLVFIAAGIGITPFMSMLKFITEEKLSYKVTLIYSNRDKISTPFLEELEDLSKKNQKIKLVFTMTQDQGWNGEKRRIDAQFINDYTAGLKNPYYFVAGPPDTVEAIVEVLHKAGVEQADINADNFSGY